MELSEADLKRYSRHLLLTEVGHVGQDKLRAARVLIVGAGGLGSPAALYLAAAGVGTLGVLDCDHIDLSNLQRQILFDTDDVARPKAPVARERLLRLNPQIAVVAHSLELCAANVASILGQYDLVVDGSDRIGTRYLINDGCVIFRKPLISAAIHRFEGQAMTYVPDRGPCYRCLFPDAAQAQIASCAEAGVLGVLPGVMGTIQATEAIKLILGLGDLLVGRLLTYDALEMRFQEFCFDRRPDCTVCGRAPRITAPADADPVCLDAPGSLRRLLPRELAALLQEADRGGPPVQMIDVREPTEFAAGHLAGAVSVPIAQIESMEWATSRPGPTVFLCRSGARSLRACALASRRGLHEPAHLDGGLIAWAAAIDPTLHIA